LEIGNLSILLGTLPKSEMDNGTRTLGCSVDLDILRKSYHSNGALNSQINFPLILKCPTLLRFNKNWRGS